MPSIARPHVWLPGQRAARFPKPLKNPKALQWSQPKAPSPPARTPTILDEETTAGLIAQANEWETEASKLEDSISDEGTRQQAALALVSEPGHRRSSVVSVEPKKIEFDLGVLLNSMENRSKGGKKFKLDDELKSWDASGDGSITQGEFRIHLRTLGLKAHISADIDALFDSFDEDTSGKITLVELNHALRRLQRVAAAYAGAEEQNRLTRQKAAALRARVSAANEAIACADKAISCEQALQVYKKDLGGRLDLQLGELLVRRGIKVGEIIGTWPKTRGRDNMKHNRELAKAEWKDEISALGLVVGDEFGSTRPASRKELGALFDEIDQDKSGWLDLKEAKDSLKKWQELSKEAAVSLKEKEKELARLRRRAARQLQAALRVPDEAPPLPSSSEVNSPANVVDSEGMSSPGTPDSTSGFLVRLRIRRAKQEENTKQEKKRAAAERARQALMRLQQRDLSRGWVAWLDAWKERSRNTEQLRGTLRSIMHIDVARGWRAWLGEYEQLIRLVSILQAAAVNINHRDQLRGWHGWVEWRSERREQMEWEQRMRKIGHQFGTIGAHWEQRPKLRIALGRWRAFALRSSGRPEAVSLLSSEPSGQISTPQIIIPASMPALVKLFESVTECVRPK